MDTLPGVMRIPELGIWVQGHPAIVLWIMGGAVLFVVLVKLVTAARHEGSTTHGSARWATAREIRKAGLHSPGGIILGKVRGKVLRVSHGNVLLCGPPGSGKDWGTNFPTTRTWPHSAIIADVKDQGENFETCGAVRANLGPVYRFAPAMRQSHCINLLDAVRVGYPEEFQDVTFLVKSLLAPPVKHEVRTDTGGFFGPLEETILRGVLLYVLHYAPDDKRHLSYALTLMADAAACLAHMHGAAHQEVQRVGLRLTSMLQESPRQFTGAWDGALRGLQMFRDPLVAAHTSTSDFRLIDLQYGDVPVTLYLIAEAPTQMGFLYPIFRAVMELTLHLLETVPVRYRHKRHELLWLLNECPAFGYMPLIEEAPATARSYGMQFLVCVQNLEQLWQVFGRQTPLWGNLSTQVFHAPGNPETAQRLSQILDKKTVYATSQSIGGGRKGRTTHPHGRDLMTPAEVHGLPTSDLLIFTRACAHPIRAQKLRYDTDRY